ncbi:MAG TPA: hypothetical protein DDZ83_00870, partial [Nitrospinae bacterium]|nr:hypothetical protein [Nitrospinota bacterium]
MRGVSMPPQHWIHDGGFREPETDVHLTSMVLIYFAGSGNGAGRRKTDRRRQKKTWTTIDILPQRRTMIGYGLMTMPWGSFPTRIDLTT